MFPDLNDIEDDNVYTIDGLGVKLTGRVLKENNLLILRRPRKAAEEDERSAKRYFPDADRPQVYQYCLDLPAYKIFSTFDGVKQLIQELNLPNPPLVYYSSLWRGGEYVNPRQPIKEFQEYTVETFGLKTDLTHPPMGTSKDWYNDHPSYWRELDWKLVQIWRLRIFRCAPKALETTPSNPLSPQYPAIPYLEERWHPQLGKIVFLGGLQRINIASAMELYHFFCDAYRILKRRRKMGRPYGTREFLDFLSFYRRVVKEYTELLNDRKRNGRPTQPEVALKLKISISSFKRYWRTTELIWPPIADPPE